MKTIKKILCILLLLPIFSCEKYLDRQPLTMYEMDVVLTVEGMEMLLTGAYSIMAGSGYYGQRLYLYEAAKGPDFFMRNVGGGASFTSETAYTTSTRTNSNALALWETAYRAIRNLTILINNIENVRGDVEVLRRIKGEALLLRGLCYFDLMRLFAYPPIFSIPGHSRYQEVFQWGVPIINTVKEGSTIFETEVRRETAETTFAFIVDQFQRAYNLLEGRPSTLGYANAPTAKALLIRTYLYLENWGKVIELGESWIGRYGARYSMIPWESYPTTYYKPFNSESVWEFNYTTASNNLGATAINFWVRRPTYNEPGSPNDGKVSENLGYAKLGFSWGHPIRGLDFLQVFPNDIRQYLICEMGIEGFPDYYTIRRYVGNPTHSVHNIPVVRLPEIYLSIAEAHAQEGNLEEASYYTSLVSIPRRKMATNVTSVFHVLDERRREFILEGHTYWDFYRTNRDLTERQIIEANDNSLITFSEAIFGRRSYRTVYPIPLAEMNANPAIRNQQNPGYADWVFAIEEDD
jgi:hypothetical protein